MHNDTIKVANKIISYEDLYEIFSAMNEKLVKYKKIYEKEQEINKDLSYGQKKWTFQDCGSKIRFDINFYDDTEVRFDNYNNFISIFNSRLHEIKSINVDFRMSYMKHEPGEDIYNSPSFNQYIDMNIREDKMSIEVSLSSSDGIIDDVYKLIKSKILNAPEKYDKVIKKRKLISNTVGMAISFIPSLIITTALLFVPTIREVFSESYILYPICCLLLVFFIGRTISGIKLDKLYENLLPEKKYAGFDKQNYKSIYKDDIDKYLSTSEILIGNNVDNIRKRNQIMENYNRFKKFIPFELLIMIAISIVVIFLGGN